MFSDHHGIIIEISKKRILEILQIHWKQTTYSQKTNESRRKSWNTLENILRWIKNEDKHNKHMSLTQCLDGNL